MRPASSRLSSDTTTSAPARLPAPQEVADTCSPCLAGQVSGPDLPDSGLGAHEQRGSCRWRARRARARFAAPARRANTVNTYLLKLASQGGWRAGCARVSSASRVQACELICVWASRLGRFFPSIWLYIWPLMCVCVSIYIYICARLRRLNMHRQPRESRENCYARTVDKCARKLMPSNEGWIGPGR